MGAVGVFACGYNLLFFRSRKHSLRQPCRIPFGRNFIDFAARGDAFGLMLMMTFSAIYAFVAFTTKYYGEMIIYLGMQIPCATASLISWLRHPSDKGSAEVKIGKFNKKHVYILIPLTAAIVTAFFFVLKTLGTENLIVSTVSVGTSFVALYLMTLRIPAYALVFILNDIVLIVLWSMACANDLNHLALVVCFSIFLINDTYTFICWTRRKARQDRKFNEQPDPSPKKVKKSRQPPRKPARRLSDYMV